jgi:hypothetical protein
MAKLASGSSGLPDSTVIDGFRSMLQLRGSHPAWARPVEVN